MSQDKSDSNENHIRVELISVDMGEPDIELPAPEELADWFRATRETHDITQTMLADRAGISPSQISRVESRSGDASYETMYRIHRELRSIIEAQSGSTKSVEEVLAEKRQAYGEEYGLIGAEPSARVEDVAEKMAALNVSQLPVITRDGESVGRITERDLIDEDCKERDRVKKHMRTPFPEVGTGTPAPIARDLLSTNEAILIIARDTDDVRINVDLVTAGSAEDASVSNHHYAGILTRADFTPTDADN